MNRLLKILPLMAGIVLAPLTSVVANASQNPLSKEAYRQKEKMVQSEVEQQNGQALYDIGSVSKVFTATAVMQLVESGRIDLDAPITVYLPEFTMADTRYKKITTRMLLNHSSGLLGAHLGDTMIFETNEELTNKSQAYEKKLLEYLRNERLQTDPGTYASYSNDGITLAQMIVERVSQLSFSDYMKTYVFEPLHMDNSMTPEKDQSNIEASNARCYVYGNYLMPQVRCMALGSGGLMSTTEDLCKFSTLFMKDTPGDVLSKSAAKAMMGNEYGKTTYLNLKGSQLEQFGLGFDSVQMYPFDQYGIQVVKKGGSVNYHQCNLSIAPDYNCSAAVLSSGGKGDYDVLVCNAILEAVLQEKGAIPKNKDGEDNSSKMSHETGADHNAVSDRTDTVRDAVAIPSEIKSYAGHYSGAKWYEISFPTDTTMQVTTCDEDATQQAVFEYMGNGEFVNKEGYYFSDQKMIRPSIGRVDAKAYFVKESDGNVYLCSSFISEVEGMGAVSDVENSLKRQVANPVNADVLDVWSSRLGKCYFPVYDSFNSTSWSATVWGSAIYDELKLSEAVPGYVSGKKRAGICKIIDKNYAQFAGLTCNAADIQFVTEGDTEYLTIGCKDYKMIPEDKIGTYNGEKICLKADKANTVQWYKISDTAAGQQKNFLVTGNGAIYVYNRYRNFEYSTLMLNGGTSVALPKGGYMVFVGEDEAEISIE